MVCIRRTLPMAKYSLTMHPSEILRSIFVKSDEKRKMNEMAFFIEWNKIQWIGLEYVSANVKRNIGNGSSGFGDSGNGNGNDADASNNPTTFSYWYNLFGWCESQSVSYRNRHLWVFRFPLILTYPQQRIFRIYSTLYTQTSIYKYR